MASESARVDAILSKWYTEREAELEWDEFEEINRWLARGRADGEVG